MMLKDKVIVVTGGKGLLGQEFIKHLASQGAIAVSADILADETNPLEYKLDITQEENVTQFVNEIIAKYGKLDGWVNNAYPRTADWGKADFENEPIDSWRKNIDMHLNGYTICCKVVLNQMKKQSFGSLINISSIYGIQGPDFTVYKDTPIKNPAAYAAIKGGIVNLSRYLAAYYGPSGVRVNCVSPGGIFDKQHPTFVESYSTKTPLKRMALPADIAPSIAFMLSDGAAYITGHNLIVDGGWSIV